MGQKQSYSLNDGPNNKSAVEDEVAHTFNNTEPTPVSLRPMKSVRSSSSKSENKIADICCEEAPVTEVNTHLTVISTPIPIIYTLTIDPELPHSIFVLDKENVDSEQIEKELVEETMARLDGILIRHQELDELVSKNEPETTITSESEFTTKIECQSDELVPEAIVVEEDDPESEESEKFSPHSSMPVPYLPGDPYRTSIYEEHLLYRLPELA